MNEEEILVQAMTHLKQHVRAAQKIAVSDLILGNFWKGQNWLAGLEEHMLTTLYPEPDIELLDDSRSERRGQIQDLLDEVVS